MSRRKIACVRGTLGLTLSQLLDSAAQLLGTGRGFSGLPNMNGFGSDTKRSLAGTLPNLAILSLLHVGAQSVAVESRAQTRASTREC